MAPCTFRGVWPLTDFRNQALASTPCIFPGSAIYLARYDFRKSRSRLDAVHILGCSAIDRFHKSSSRLDAVQIFMQRRFTSLDMTLEDRALASTPCTFQARLRLSWGCLGLSWALLGLSWGSLGPVLGVWGLSWAKMRFFENRALAFAPCTFLAIGKLPFPAIELWP